MKYNLDDKKKYIELIELGKYSLRSAALECIYWVSIYYLWHRNFC
ncbi:hypothetical protein [Anaeromonas frigoriresistens]|nr:hypothetical protein [Anaeromonas frigoriresistens]